MNIIIVIIIIIYRFNRGIYNHVPETNCVSGLYNTAAVLLLRFMLHVMLFLNVKDPSYCISTFRSMCAVPNMAVFIWFLDFVLSRCVAQVFSE